ncbi:MAG: hypothetical protein V3S98_05195 [Dehalococcoidia bacterium]
MSFLKSFPGLSRKESSRPELQKPKKIKPNLDLLGFDLLFQLTHLSAVAAAGVTRAKLFKIAAAIPSTTAHYFDEIDQIVTTMNYQYAEACRVVGERAQEEDVQGFFLRFSSALNSGENEADFLAAEAEIQADSYGNVYERQLESLKKWTDAFTALIVSAALIIVVATVSTMIFDLGTTFVGGLVLSMIGISGMGVWIIYRASPRELRTLTGERALRSQGKTKKAFTLLLPAAFVLASLMALFGMSFGAMLIGFGVTIIPVGVLARRLDRQITKVDQDVSTFVRVLGATVSAIGTTPVVAIGRMDMRAMPTLTKYVAELRTRLVARIGTTLSWDRLVDETGSELVRRSLRVFLDGTSMGGDADEVGKLTAVMGLKLNQLRAKRRLVADSFAYLSLAMHIVISFLLIFIIEVVNGFNTLIATANVDIAGGSGAALGAVLSFNLANLRFLQYSMAPVVIVLGVVNALAPKIASGGYSHTFYYHLGLNMALSGVALVIAPVLAGVIFQAGTAVPN